MTFSTCSRLHWVFALFLLGAATNAHAQTRYVTDEFEIMLRTGPSVQNKIVKALKSGTRLEVLRLDAGNGHSQVQTSRGEIGYVLTRFLSQNPSARNRVRYLEEQLEQLKSKPGELQSLLVNSQDENQELIRLNTELTDQLQKATTELSEIQRISGDSVKLAQKAAKLEAEVQQLLLQLDDIRIQNETLKDQSAKRWYVLGSGTVFLGLLLGWILSIAKRPRRNSWGA